ncbi:DUF4342 domain-containing protein [Fusibacter bizertensis]|jgi:hypothetical protein|uniref:DUF4342 domain-containing protein n=1 Tax=Fusibacter bizertensis TaxID=1488331 RepID=A0ABT6NDF6_9FIRM|nr:DUF4342 domain-containing protein [Fusibacter bizertensis]MDH8678416.1 DUF4342 domain-containing protein [Fusibacter bizertensis]
MRITLEMVDEVINRTGVNYKTAKEALELNEADVLKAIVYLEEQSDFKTSKKLNGQDVVDRMKTLVNEGLVSQILIEKNGKTVVDLPIFAGAISAVIFTIPTVAGIIAAIATGCEIKILKKDGDEINFNDLTQTKFEDFMNMINKEKNKSQKKSSEEEADVEETELYENEEDFFVSEDDETK